MQLTPMMQQYMNIKQDYPDCILFFRLGDFYEMFFEDALIASRDMEVTLTGKSCGLEERAPMCGVPYHAVDSYVAKLIDKGHKVAICEQMEDPATTKGIVKREVVRIITPGTLMNRGLLNEKESNYLAAVSFGENGQIAGIAYCDLSTGEIGAAEYKEKRALGQLDSQIARLSLSELVLADQPLDSETDNWLSGLQCALTRRPAVDFSAGEAEKTIRRQFNVLSLEGLGLENRAQAISALGGLLAYLAHTQKQQLTHLQVLKVMDEKGRMQLDRATVRNLELTETLYDKTIKGSLLGVLDRTRTAMGARLIRQWIKAPLNEAEAVEERLEAVSVLTDQLLLRNDLREALRLIYDLERLTGRIACGGANGRDMVALARSLRVLPEIKAGITGTGAALLDQLAAAIADLLPAADLIESALVEEPPVTIKDGGLIRPGYSEPLDELKHSIAYGQEWIAGLEDSERKRSGIRNLKVGFNRVFGYYIEVTKANLAAVPEDYIRKQTLVNSERYVTPQLKEVEANVLNAETRINQTEYELFQELRDSLQVYVSAIQATSSAIAAVDVLLSFAQVGADNGYVRPEISCSDMIYIRRGRHPVLEQMSSGGQFVPNDTYIDRDEQNLLLITGPNMSGKSTYMRQTALIAMMAQCGCFVPAEEAKIGLIDRVYTRIGASDNLTQGQSTFFVEMSELANILNTATERSLVILDEIGRGTSTYDGLSIAFAVIEHLLHPERRTRTLFATHYHELTILEETLSGLTNLNVDVSDRDGEIVFLHRIVAGSASRSYGIHVAKLAGVPESVLDQADKKLAELENAPIPAAAPASVSATVEQATAIKEQLQQLNLFDSLHSHSVIERLRKLDLMEITASQAIAILEELKHAVGDEDN